MSIVISIILIILGFIFLIKGADLLVDGASNIAKKFHISKMIIGLTIVSIGTSMPELLISLTSAIEGYSDIAVGNVIGSNICNLLLILGLSAVIRPIKFQKETRLIEIPLLLVLTSIFMVICNTGKKISRSESLILLILFALFIGYTIFMAIKGHKINDEDKKEEINNIPILKNIIYVVLGIVVLKIGGDLTVDNAVAIAEQLNISEKIISLTILALGTSLPEFVTSISAVYKKSSDIAIGNIIGSNIFNILLIVGASSFIKPIIYNTSYNLDMTILLLSIVMLCISTIIPQKNKMNRGFGIAYFIGYIAYIVILLNI